MSSNNFITIFLSGPIYKDMDWVRTGKQFRVLVLPPKIDVETKFFKDALVETIPEKLEIALHAQSELKELRKRRIKLINDFVSVEHQWFFLELEVHLFEEYFYISRWINYWLELWNVVHDVPKPSHFQSNRVSDSDIIKAKNVPIQQLYHGKLKKAGKNLSGLCPFHQENHSSFFIFPNNHWRCFGACVDGGDAISFQMKMKNIGFIQAVKDLAYGHN